MLKEFFVDKLKVNIYPTRKEMGEFAADLVSGKIKELLKAKDELNIVFAAAPSQSDMFEVLIADNTIPWERINAFHMDEYIGLDAEAPQGFGNFLKTKLFSKLPLKQVFYLNGQADDVEAECNRYAELLADYKVDIVCMGVGENGHIAFNDPPVADFNDKKAVKIVELDEICRQQQVNDGCFASIDDVPKKAMTLTIPTLTNPENIFCVVPGKTKSNAIFHMLRGDVNTDCPASILRKHSNAVLLCDAQSAEHVLFRKAIITDEVSQDFEEAVKLAKKYNCEGVEIRSVWNKAPHELDDSDIESINKIAKEFGIKICAISSSVFKCDMNNPTEIEEHYRIFDKCLSLAIRTGAKYIRTFTFWKNKGIAQDADFIRKEISKLTSKAKNHDICLVIEIDPSVSAADADELNILFEGINDSNVKALWDPGNQIYNSDYKIPFPNGYNLIKEKIEHIHLKDAVRNADREGEGVVLGDGLLDTKGQLKELLKDGYDGYLVLEPHFRVESVLSEDELKLPGGKAFSEGGYVASELSFQRLQQIISEEVLGVKI